MKLKKIKIAFLLIAIVSTSINSAAAGQNPEYPFANRIIFSETPETGEQWHGGIRMKDIFCWDGYWNVGGWLTLDLMVYGINLRIPNADNGDTTTFADNFSLFSIKSRPLELALLGHPYKISGGFTAYSTGLKLKSSSPDSDSLSTPYRQTGLFIAQSWFLENREWWIFHGSHYINLVASFAAHQISNHDYLTSWYFIPGYRYFFNCPSKLSFDIEFYYMNPYELPFKLMQVAFDPDHLPFENPDLMFASYLFWGFSYSWKHLRLEAHIGHYPASLFPVLPVIGAGWDF